MIYMFLSNNPSSGHINSSNLSCFILLLFDSFHQNNKVFDQYDPHAGGLGRLVCFPLVLMNRLNETDVSVILNFL